MIANWRRMMESEAMTQPLALVLYEKLLPGTQLVNRLQDLNYRVETVSEAGRLVESAERLKPLLVIADAESGQGDVCAAIAKLKRNAATSHLPVIAYYSDSAAQLEAAAKAAGAPVVVS